MEKEDLIKEIMSLDSGYGKPNLEKKSIKELRNILKKCQEKNADK